MRDGVSKKSAWWKRILKFVVFSPIKVIFILALLYFGAQAYLFDPSFSNKTAFFLVVGLWILVTLVKHAVFLMIILVILGGGAWWYYQYSHQEQKQCEEQGGYWNSNTQVCEEKVSPMGKFKKIFDKVTQDKINSK